MNWILAAAAAAKTDPAQGGQMQWLIMLLMFGALWFFMIMPQRKQQKKRQAMLSSIKKGDKVVTIGGIYGEILELDEESVKLRVAEKTEIKFSRTAIAKVKE